MRVMRARRARNKSIAAVSDSLRPVPDGQVVSEIFHKADVSA